MITLVIQTVLPRVELLLLDQKGRMLAEAGWVSKKDEVRKVPQQMENLLKNSRKEWNDISRIVSVVGVGNFSATRIGVTMANILALAIEAGGGKVDIFELKLSSATDRSPASDKLAELISGKFRTGWTPVKIAKPVYASEPMISPSKKKIF